MDPEVFKGSQYDLHLTVYAVIFFMSRKRKIQVAQVMVNGSSPRQAPGQMTALILQAADLAFLPGILISPYDNCMTVLPQIQDVLFFPAAKEQVLLCRKVFIWVEVYAFDISKLLQHRISPGINL